MIWARAVPKMPRASKASSTLEEGGCVQGVEHTRHRKARPGAKVGGELFAAQADYGDEDYRAIEHAPHGKGEGAHL